MSSEQITIEISLYLSSRFSYLHIAVRDEFMEPAFTPLIVDASEDEVDPADAEEPELYTPGELPRPRFVMLGQQESLYSVIL